MKKQLIYVFCVVLTALVLFVLVEWFHKKKSDEISKLAKYSFLIQVPEDSYKRIEALENRINQTAPQATDLVSLAALYFAEGKRSGNTNWYEKAEEVAKKALTIEPIVNLDAKLIVAKIHGAKHAFQDSIDLALEIYKADSSKMAALSVAATSYLALGELNKAATLADQLVDQLPGLQSYGLRGLIMESQGRRNEAISDFKRALKNEDIGEMQESAWIRCMMARSLMKQGDYTGSQLLLKESLKIIPNYHLAYDLLGDLSQRKGDYLNAEKYFKLAFQSSKQLAYLIHEEKLMLIQGKKELAQEIQNQAELLLRDEVEKNGYGHRLDLAAVLLDRGLPSDLQQSLQLAEDEVKVRQSSQALVVLAQAQLATGKAQSALKTMRQVLQTGSRDSEYYYLMARVQKANNNAVKAAFYMKEAVDLEPQNQQLQKNALEFQITN